MCHSVSPIKKNYCFHNGFPKTSRICTDKTYSPTPNARHWLNQCHHVRMLKQHSIVLKTVGEKKVVKPCESQNPACSELNLYS